MISVICKDPAWVVPIAKRLTPPVCEIRPVPPADLHLQPEFDDQFVEGGAEPFSQYVVCMEDNWAAVDFVLQLREATAGRIGGNAPVFCSPPQMMGGWTWSETGGSAHPYPSTLVTAFGVSPPSVLGWRQVVAQQQDTMARLNHQTYVAQATKASSPGTAPKPAVRPPWAELGEPFRFSNRSFVDHISAKLVLIGCTLAEKGSQASAELTEEEFNLMARAEHDRWVAERLVLDGNPARPATIGARSIPTLCPGRICPRRCAPMTWRLSGTFPSWWEAWGGSGSLG